MFSRLDHIWEMFAILFIHLSFSFNELCYQVNISTGANFSKKILALDRTVTNNSDYPSSKYVKDLPQQDQGNHPIRSRSIHASWYAPSRS